MPDFVAPGGLPTPPAPLGTGPFGLAVDAEAFKATTQTAIDTAQQVAGALIGKVNQYGIDTVAQTAVAADALKQQIAQSIAGPVMAAQTTAQALQQPIVSSIVNTLGSAVEQTMPLGVMLPQAGQEAACPACVAIRVSAAAGDLGPALDYYRANIFPLRDIQGIQYAQQLTTLEQYLPTDLAIQGAFLKAVATIQNEPPTRAGYAAVAGPTAPALVPIQPGGNPLFRTEATATAPVYAFPGGETGIPTATASSLTLEPMPSATEISAMTLAQFQAKYGGTTSIHTAINANVPGSKWTYTTRHPDGSPAGCLEIVLWDVSAGAPGKFLFAVSPSDYAQACFLPRGQPGSATAPGEGPIPTPPPFIPPPGTPGGTTSPGIVPLPPAQTPFQRPPSFIPETPAYPPYQPPPSPRPPGYVPEQPAYPPIPPMMPPSNSCDNPLYVKVCQDQAPCDEPEYCLWCDASGVLYIIKKDDPPRSSSDKKVQCGKATAFNFRSALLECVQKQPQYQPPGGGAGLPGLGAQDGCDGLYRFRDLLGLITPTLFRDIFDKAAQALAPIHGTGLAAVDAGLTSARDASFDIVGVLADSLINAFAGANWLNCSGTSQEGLIQATRLVLGLIRRWVADIGESTDVPLQYAQNTLCPYKIPSNSEAVTAWLGNTISADRLKCIVEANGNRWDSFSQVVDAARSKLAPQQYAFLYRRGLLDRPTYDARVRETGLTRQEDRNGALELTRQVPPYTDLVRLMVRDAVDDINIDWSKEDALFPQKFKGDIEKWANWQGIDADVMKLLWRAHFSIPAPGQLAVMLHRLSRLPQGDPAYVDLQTVRNALIQQDIAPRWVDKFVAISYAPLTRIDARRAFEIGALSAADLKEAYLNLGYDSKNADTLVDFNRRNVQRTFLRRSEVTQLAKGEMSDAEFTQAMQQWGADDAAIQAGRDRATVLRSVASRKRCVDSYRKRFLIGEFDDQYATQLVMAQQIDLNAATVLVSGWKCERDARGKLFSASQLNDLYTAGLIDDMDYIGRAKRLGWDDADAVKLLRLLQRKLNIKATTQAAKDLAAQERANARLQKALLQQMARDEANRAKQAKAVRDAQKLRDLRTKRLTAAAEKFSVHSAMRLEDAIRLIQSVYTGALNSYPVTPDEVIGALTVITSDADVTTSDLLGSALATALTVQAS